MKFIPTKGKKRTNSGLPNMYLGKRVIEFPLYLVWNSMRQRCYNPKVKNYHRWGGRGIKVCKKWRESFIHFYEWAISNGYKKGLSIDRKNNNGNYSPKNCHFITAKKQVQNMSKTKMVKWHGKSTPLSALCEKYNMPYYIVNGRISRGWDLDKALNTPNLAGKTHLYKRRPKLDMLFYAENTGNTYIDRKGNIHPIYRGRTGKLFFKKISDNGKIYKYFLTEYGKPYSHYKRKY